MCAPPAARGNTRIIRLRHKLARLLPEFCIQNRQRVRQCAAPSIDLTSPGNAHSPTAGRVESIGIRAVAHNGRILSVRGLSANPFRRRPYSPEMGDAVSNLLFGAPLALCCRESVLTTKSPPVNAPSVGRLRERTGVARACCEPIAEKTVVANMYPVLRLVVLFSHFRLVGRELSPIRKRACPKFTISFLGRNFRGAHRRRARLRSTTVSMADGARSAMLMRRSLSNGRAGGVRYRVARI